MNNYFNHSGGCHGADLEWDRIGRELGFNNHKHYRPADLKAVTKEVREQIDDAVFYAATALGRPTVEFPGKDLVRRNWFQANGAEAIYAISRIINPGDLDKGFVNHSGKQLVAGGTGWAVEMGIQMGKQIHVFDVFEGMWFEWDGHKFVEEITPILTYNYAGIGSRNMTDTARQAIRDVYLLALKTKV